MMNPEIKALWLTALRSGKYRQGYGRLERDDAYCCLGVLCTITGTSFEPLDAFLPEELSHELGLGRSKQYELCTLNDGTNYDRRNSQTFPQIADWIEQNL